MGETKIHTLVIMGGWSHEREVSLRSGTTVYHTLNEDSYTRRCLQIMPDRTVKLLSPETDPDENAWDSAVQVSFLHAFSILAAWPCDAVVLALHGEGGEDGVIQGFLETLGIPYSHSDVRGSAAAMDKEFSKYIYQAHGIPVAPYVMVNRGDDISAIMARANLGWPVVAKPVSSGSSFGVYVFWTAEEMARQTDLLWEYENRFIIEQYIKGREFTCVVLEKGAMQAPEPLPVIEIVPGNSQFFDYKAKYSDQATKEIVPAEIDVMLTRRIQELAVASHCALKCRSVTRTDMIVSEEGGIYVLETNTIPGMTQESLLPKAGRAAGMTFSDLLDIIVGNTQTFLKERITKKPLEQKIGC